MKESLMNHAPSGAVGRATKSGRINEDLFKEWFDHFVATVQPQSRPDCLFVA